MTPHDKPDFARCLLATANKYHRPVTEQVLELYWQCLKSFSLQDIQQALITHFQNPDHGHFMPQPSDLIRILQGDGPTQALQAWSKVLHAMRRVGAYQSIVFDDFRIHAVLSDMGGWIELCLQTEDELKFRGHEFQKRYRGYLQRRPSHYSNRLIGIFEHQNQLQGYPPQPPRLFGEKPAALLTYSEGCEPHQLSAQKVTSLREALALIPSRLDDSLTTQNHFTSPEKNNEQQETFMKQNTIDPTGPHSEPEFPAHPNKKGDSSNEK